MNVTTPTDVWAGVGSRTLADEKMEQVRDLLIGDYKRQCDVQLAAMDARLRELETVMMRRLSDLEARMEALSTRCGEQQRTAFDELSRGLADLGRRVREAAR